MIRRFDKIDDGGFLAGFECASAVLRFERINVIYGPNGSGKSSLARTLHQLGRGCDFGLAVSVVCESGSSERTITDPTDSLFDRVLVFGDDYVAENHHLSQADAELEAILTVRERAEEDERRLADLRAERDRLVAQREEAKEAAGRAVRERDGWLRGVSESVVADLRSVGGIYSSRGTYSTAKVTKRLAELRSELHLLDEDALAAKKQFLNSDKKGPIRLALSKLSVGSDVLERSRALLANNPLTATLDTLESHPESASWVQHGLGLHKDRDICTFCGGPLTDARKHDIAQHFAGEVEHLQRDIDTLIGEIKSTQGDAIDIGALLPDPARLFENVREQYAAEAESVRSAAADLASWCDDMERPLRKKRENTHQQIELTSTNPPVVDPRHVLEVCAEHDRQVAEHDQLVNDYALTIELHHLATVAPKLDELTSQEDEAKKRHAALDEGLKEVGKKVTALENIEGDPGPSAEVLTREVEVLLGRKELEFVAVASNKFRVLRHGKPAIGLSDGERTAVTMVHFLEMVERFDASNGKPIVIIDDPVSSLDSNIFHGISTRIWTAAISKRHDRIAQLFLLTHNFELFRQWDIQLESLSNSRDGNNYPSKLFELRSNVRATAEGTRRGSELVAWPPSSTARRKMRSSYHHAFLSLADTRQKLLDPTNVEARLDAQLICPNVIRRVLETFLAFKNPNHDGGFDGAMRGAVNDLVDGGYTGDADALRQRLTRFTHAYSHADDPNVDRIVDPAEIEPTLDATFLFMRHVDDPHFVGLCKALGVEPDDLAPRSGTGRDLEVVVGPES